MSIPQNFRTVEQRVLAVTATTGNVGFTKTAPAGQGTDDLLVENAGTKNCQLALGFNSSLSAVVNSNAGGTSQTKILAGSIVMLKKDAATYVAAICEGSDTTTLYLHAGKGQ